MLSKPDEFCKPCGLHKLCKTPFMDGEGAAAPVYFWVGEGPGETEDEEGFPFCGKAGTLLRDSIEEFYIPMPKCRFSNVVRCRPPENKIDKFPDAIDYCRPHILREIHVCNPKVVVLLGNSATDSILHRRGIKKLHGKIIKEHGRYYVCCIHPSYYLRNPNEITEFKRVIKMVAGLLKKKSRSAEAQKGMKTEYIRDRKMLQEYTDMLKKKEFLTTDIEGSTLSPFDRGDTKPSVGCVGFGYDVDSAICYPFNSRVDVKIKVSVGECREAVKEIWGSIIRFCLHFGKYDVNYMKVVEKIFLKNYAEDSGLQSYALDHRKAGRGVLGLKYLAWDVGMGSHDDEINEYFDAHPEADPDKGGNICLTPGDIFYRYNGLDNIASYRLCLKNIKRLRKRDLYDKPYQFPIMYLNNTAAVMEKNGLNVDEERNSELREEFPAHIAELDKDLRQYGEVRNLEGIALKKLIKAEYERVTNYKRPVPNVKNRVMELVKKHWEPPKLTTAESKRTLVFKIMKFEPKALTNKTQQPSTERWVLEECLKDEPKNEVLQKLIEMGTYDSANSKYIKPVPSWIGSDGRIHTSFLPHGQVTGRVSSEKPNLENLPARQKISSTLTSQFVPGGENYILGKSDEKQIELRLLGDEAQDDVMIEEFNQGKDPHMMAASAGFEIPEEKVTKEQRSFAKNAISFGVQYRRKAPALAADMGWTTEKAQEFIDRYFSKYDDCYKLGDVLIEKISEPPHGLRSKFGYYWEFPDIESEDQGTYERAVRELINYPIQNCASCITWTAAWRIARFLKKYRMKTKLVDIVHDAIFLDIYRKELQDVVPVWYEYMIDRKWIEKMTGWHCTVPLDIDMALSNKNWGAMVELEHKPLSGEFKIPSEFTA